MAVVGVAVHAHASVDNPRVDQSRKCGGQKFTQGCFVVGRYDAVGGVGGHLAPRTVISNLHHTVAIDRKSVVAARCYVCAENGKTLRRKQLGLRRLQVKHWLPGRMEKLLGERQQIRRPRANGHDDEISSDSLSIIERDAVHTMVSLVEV